MFNGPLFRTTWVSSAGTIKVKQIWIYYFTEVGLRDSEWQWYQLAMCKSAPRCRQITTPAPYRRE